jgi:hypothetical protein
MALHLWSRAGTSQRLNLKRTMWNAGASPAFFIGFFVLKGAGSRDAFSVQMEQRLQQKEKSRAHKYQQSHPHRRFLIHFRN